MAVTGGLQTREKVILPKPEQFPAEKKTPNPSFINVIKGILLLFITLLSRAEHSSNKSDHGSGTITVRKESHILAKGKNARLSVSKYKKPKNASAFS